ncbi:MAG: T9SS type A sorting domain-containing protein [Bacteroidia bacterium]|nr:T9SS type A sorting domain-containing protein [Bacteroidia bacterium]
MKRLVFTLSVFALLATQSKAQVICSPDPNACVPSDTTAACIVPYPVLELLVNENVPANKQELRFVIAQTANGGPLGQVTVKKVKISDIVNIPAGLTWQPAAADSTYNDDNVKNTQGKDIGPYGCVKLTGTPTTLNAVTDSVAIRLNVTVQSALGPITQPQDFKYRIAIVSTLGIDHEVVSNLKLNVFPNPAQEITKVRFSLTKPQSISIRIYDMHGRVVSTQTKGMTPAGEYEETLDISSLPSGLYNVAIQVGEYQTSRKLVKN